MDNRENNDYKQTIRTLIKINLSWSDLTYGE